MLDFGFLEILINTGSRTNNDKTKIYYFTAYNYVFLLVSKKLIKFTIRGKLILIFRFINLHAVA